MNASSTSDVDSLPADIFTAGSDACRPTLLIVDDEEGPRQSIRFVFKEDYNILMADNGVTALELAREHPVDAAVLDIRMAGMSGIEVLNGLKELDPTIEVVMLTAYETLDTARQALRLGACDYLNKPFDIATLRLAVKNAMERHAVSREMRENSLRLRELQEEIRSQRVQEELARNRGDIYASVIHDINGPLTVISGFVETLNLRLRNVQSLEGEKLEIVRDRLARMSRQVSNCVQISRRYLSFLHGNAREQSVVSVNQVLSDIKDLLEAHPDAAQNQISVASLPHDMMVEANGTDLIQMLWNLAINACQSSVDTVRVEIGSRVIPETLDFSSRNGDGGVRYINRDAFNNVAPFVALSVQDDGPGIPDDLLNRIFEPYFTTKSAGRGTGLGLSIVRRLVEQSKGVIELKTVFGRGTTFTVFLPARHPAGAEN